MHHAISTVEHDALKQSQSRLLATSSAFLSCPDELDLLLADGRTTDSRCHSSCIDLTSVGSVPIRLVAVALLAMCFLALRPSVAPQSQTSGGHVYQLAQSADVIVTGQ